MKKQDYTASIKVNATTQEAFDAINNVAEWWSADLEGLTEKLNNSFTAHFGEVYITSTVVESIPGKKIAWLVTDCNKPWLKNTKEWVDTKISWEITEDKGATEIKFTHIGLVPGVECYNGCENAWNEYIKGSLFKLLTEGKGVPEMK